MAGERYHIDCICQCIEKGSRKTTIVKTMKFGALPSKRYSIDWNYMKVVRHVTKPEMYRNQHLN